MQVVIAWGVFIRQKELHKRDLGIRYSVQINWGCYSVAKNILPLYPITYSEVVREWINDTFQWYREKSLQYTLTASKAILRFLRNKELPPPPPSEKQKKQQEF